MFLRQVHLLSLLEYVNTIARPRSITNPYSLQMNIRDAILIVLFANLLSAVVIVLNSRAAAKYHLGFPALARVAFGSYGAYFYIVLRSILGIIWVSTSCVYSSPKLAADSNLP